MPGDPRIRASDADRGKTASLLGKHHAVGRLTAEEFADRVDRAYAATTIGELDELLSDLPVIDLYDLPSEGVRRGCPPAPPGIRPSPPGTRRRGRH
jgi:hypothetical protein